MSDVKVDTNLSIAEYGILAGLFALIVGVLYFAGFNVKNVALLVAVMCLTVLALLLYGLLTASEKVADFIVNHQLMSLIAACLVSGTMVVSLFGIGSVKFMHS